MAMLADPQELMQCCYRIQFRNGANNCPPSSPLINHQFLRCLSFGPERVCLVCLRFVAGPLQPFQPSLFTHEEEINRIWLP